MSSVQKNKKPDPVSRDRASSYFLYFKASKWSGIRESNPYNEPKKLVGYKKKKKPEDFGG